MNEEQQVEQRHYFNRVTKLSKLLTLVALVILPFLGGWIGYNYAPAETKEVSDTAPTLDNSFSLSFSNTTEFSDFVYITDYDKQRSIRTASPSSEYVEIVFYSPNSVLSNDTLGDVYIIVIPTLLSLDLPCADGESEGEMCHRRGPEDVRVRLDYYSMWEGDYVLFYSEEMGIGILNSVTYVPLHGSYGEDSFSFIQSRADVYCCDDLDVVYNRLFEVDLRNRKTKVRELDGYGYEGDQTGVSVDTKDIEALIYVEEYPCSKYYAYEEGPCYKLIQEDGSEIVLSTDLTAEYQREFDSSYVLDRVFDDFAGKATFFQAAKPHTSACCEIVKFDLDTLHFTRQDTYDSVSGEKLSPSGQYLAVVREGNVRIIDNKLGKTIKEDGLGLNETVSYSYCGYGEYIYDLEWVNENVLEYGVYDPESSKIDKCNLVLIEKRKIEID